MRLSCKGRRQEFGSRANKEKINTLDLEILGGGSFTGYKLEVQIHPIWIARGRDDISNNGNTILGASTCVSQASVAYACSLVAHLRVSFSLPSVSESFFWHFLGSFLYSRIQANNHLWMASSSSFHTCPVKVTLLLPPALTLTSNTVSRRRLPFLSKVSSQLNCVFQNVKILDILTIYHCITKFLKM